MRTRVLISLLAVLIVFAPALRAADNGRLSFKTPPTTQDELAIAELLERQRDASVAPGDLPKLLSVFADDAKIDSSVAKAKYRQSPVDKALYAEAMEEYFVRVKTYHQDYSDLVIEFQDQTHATVQGKIVAKTVVWKSYPWVGYHRWYFEKRSHQWLVVRTQYE